MRNLMNSWGIKDITITIPSGGGGSTTNTPIDINPAADNTEYTLTGITYKGQPIYYQWYNVQKRVSTSANQLVAGVDVFIHQGLTVQGISGGKPTGVKWILPYIHTNSVGVILQINNGSLQIQAQTSEFSGTYQIAGLLIYTKAASN